MASRMQVCARAAEGRTFAELTALLVRFHEDYDGKRYVCFWPQSRHAERQRECPLPGIADLASRLPADLWVYGLAQARPQRPDIFLIYRNYA